MKWSLFLITLVAVLCTSVGFCQEEEGNEDLIAAENQLEHRRIQLKWQESESETDFRQQMRELELEERRIELEHQRAKLKYQGHWKHRNKRGAVPFLMLCLAVHILVTVWVYQDIRKQNKGSGIWIVIALLSGLLGALVYSIVRLGDNRKT